MIGYKPSLDTRAPHRTAHAASPVATTETTAANEQGAVAVTIFRRLVDGLLASDHRDRAALRTALITRLRHSEVPDVCIGELLELCATRGGPDGLDTAIDVLSHLGDFVLAYIRQFLKSDMNRWTAAGSADGLRWNDDKWYILLRAAARSNVEDGEKFRLLRLCGEAGTASMREATIHAMGDIGGDQAIRYIREIAGSTADPMVRETAEQVVDDLEG